MIAFLSGQAAVAVLQGKSPQVRTLDGRSLPAKDANDALRIFDGCTDVERVEYNNVSDLDLRLRRSWSSDRALKLLLIILDPHELAEDLPEYVACLEGLLQVEGVGTFIRNRLASAPLPLIELKKIEAALNGAPNSAGIFSEIMGLQDKIGKISKALADLPEVVFSSDGRVATRNALSDMGLFYELASALEAGGDLTFLRLKFINRARNYANVINSLSSSLIGDLSKRSRTLEVQTSDDFEWEEEQLSYQNPEIYARIVSQKSQIVQRLRDRDIDSARRFTVELIEGQRQSSTADQIAKSLCSLAQQAKRFEVPELQVEWSEWATKENPADAMTFGHYADALINVGRYFDAEAAIELTVSGGDLCFVATTKARILRALGRVEEAHKAYVFAAAEYVDLPGARFAEVGVAETLRDLGESVQALTAYQKLTNDHPLDAVCWNGLASTLMDLGRFDEAISTFGKASSVPVDRQSMPAISKNGRATALKLSGEFEKALNLYDDIVSEYPNNHVALCGRAEVYRLMGATKDALAAYDVALERCSHSPVPYSGKANYLREIGDLEAALALYERAHDLFPHDRLIAIGIVSALRATGSYVDALNRAETLHRQYPFDSNLGAMRADLLYRLGKSADAFVAFDEILAEKPNHIYALNGKAALLISIGRSQEALDILPSSQARTQTDWSRYVLRAIAVNEVSGAQVAVQLLEQGIKACRFANQRKILRSALAEALLQNGRFTAARRVVEAAPEEVSNIIAMSVFASTQRPISARKYYSAIQSSGHGQVLELADEIARRHNLTAGAPRHSEAWIIFKQREFLVRDAV